MPGESERGCSQGQRLLMIEAALFTMRQLTMLAGSMRKNVWNT